VKDGLPVPTRLCCCCLLLLVSSIAVVGFGEVEERDKSVTARGENTT